jgi:hypothetical protein
MDAMSRDQYSRVEVLLSSLASLMALFATLIPYPELVGELPYLHQFDQLVSNKDNITAHLNDVLFEMLVRSVSRCDHGELSYAPFCTCVA